MVPLHKQVLVVDDNEHIRKNMGFCLTQEGYTVFLAPEGQAALAIVQTQPVDLMLVDIKMPIMDGVTFVQEYRNRALPDVPIILMSAAAKEQLNLPVDVTGFLAKPFDIEALLKCVERYLNK